jgi:hypothetical protein
VKTPDINTHLKNLAQMEIFGSERGHIRGRENIIALVQEFTKKR